VSAADGRETRRLETGDRAWLVSEAWRGESGWGVAYFVALGSDAPLEDDRQDRSALLEPGARIADLEDAELGRLLEDAAGLTSTERRFRGPGGRVWLAQSRGPVWAEGGVAAGLTGLLFTSLEGPFERIEGPDGQAGDLDGAALVSRLGAARGAPGREEPDA
jgi:hypothetical protein